MIFNKNNVLTKIEESDIVNGKLVLPCVDVVSLHACSNNQLVHEVEASEGIMVIGENAFTNCDNLKIVSLPQSLTSLGSEAFMGCDNLREIEIPAKIKYLELSTFEDCPNLTKVKLPQGLKIIYDGVFNGCFKLKNINLPKTLESIGASAFSSCGDIEEIEIPENVRTIGDWAFARCHKIKKINIPENVQVIESSVFQGCDGLKEVTFSNNVKVINPSAFCSCISLKGINLPEGLQILDKKVFENCQSLNIVYLPSSLSSIGKSCFENCRSLEEIKIPQNIKIVEENLFFDCVSLKDVVFPEGLEKIGPNAFANCYSLQDVNVPTNIKQIREYAFEKCNLLVSINVQNALVGQGAFRGCENLVCVEIGADAKFFDIPSDNNFCENLKYLTKVNDKFFLTSEPINEESFLIKGSDLSIGVIMALWERRNEIKLFTKNAKVYNTMFELLDKKDFVNFYNNHNLKFFAQVEKKIKDVPAVYKACCLMFYNLGGFLKPIVEEVKTKSGKIVTRKIDYAQKVGEFLKENIGVSKFLDSKIILKYFLHLKADGFKREFTDFILTKDNFKQMIRKGVPYFNKCYNEFEIIQEANKSNKGSQRQLLPTFERFDLYCERKPFQGVNDDNLQLATVISKYYYSQDIFDEVLSILNEWENNGGVKQILKNPVKDPFSKIENLQQDIEENIKDTFNCVLDGAIYTYEWLDKDSPENFILGKLCSCCAHLDAVGYGIVKASVVNPDVQNLVIKQDDKIYAKATIYVNREKGYGVINTAEVNERYREYNPEMTYKKLKMAVKDFAEQYNRENPQKPLKKVNIGMNLNHLAMPIIKYDKKAESILPALVYATYGKEDMKYNGDSDYDQYTIWEKEE